MEEIHKILKDHEKRIKNLESGHMTLSDKPTKKGKKTTRDLLLELKSEGFFKVPKHIGEIVNRLNQKTYNVSSSDLTLPLRKLVRDNELERVEKDGQWAYVAR